MAPTAAIDVSTPIEKGRAGAGGSSYDRYQADQHRNQHNLDA
jgi:hypothetical protein